MAKTDSVSTLENPLVCNDSVSECCPQVRFSSPDVFVFVFPVSFVLLRLCSLNKESVFSFPSPSTCIQSRKASIMPWISCLHDDFDLYQMTEPLAKLMCVSLCMCVRLLKEWKLEQVLYFSKVIKSMHHNGISFSSCAWLIQVVSPGPSQEARCSEHLQECWPHIPLVLGHTLAFCSLPLHLVMSTQFPSACFEGKTVHVAYRRGALWVALLVFCRNQGIDQTTKAFYHPSQPCFQMVTQSF